MYNRLSVNNKREENRMAATVLSKNNFYQQIQEGVVLVDFWAPWCGPCKMQLPIVEELAEELKGKAKMAKVNVDEEKELTTEFTIASVPTLILFKNGKVVDRVSGLQTKSSLHEKILGQVDGCGCEL
ncbi:thioredoxin [Bacillus songklensis]|uniref:Thioredoxin n=1 Tax=Bacillus songklensis TaxID=1069116 RepID=A0ABV8B5S2_9BACI